MTRGCRRSGDVADIECLGHEVAVELEDGAMAGVGVDDQRAVGQATSKVVCVRRRHHAVGIAVGNEHGMLDDRQIRRLLQTPGAQRFQLGEQRAHGDLRVTVLCPFLQARQERLACLDAVRCPGEEQELLGVLPGDQAPQNVVEGHPGHGADALAAGRSRSRKNHLAHELRILQHDFLGDHPAHRKAEQVNLLESLGLDECDGIFSHLLHRTRRRSARRTDASVVEGDHVMPGSETVHDPGVPVVEHRSQVDQQHERRAIVLLSKLTVRKVDTTRGQGLRRHIDPAVAWCFGHCRWRGLDTFRAKRHAAALVLR